MLKSLSQEWVVEKAETLRELKCQRRRSRRRRRRRRRWWWGW
jgi:hypothetical protein